MSQLDLVNHCLLLAQLSDFHQYCLSLSTLLIFACTFDHHLIHSSVFTAACCHCYSPPSLPLIFVYTADWHWLGSAATQPSFWACLHQGLMQLVLHITPLGCSTWKVIKTSKFRPITSNNVIKPMMFPVPSDVVDSLCINNCCFSWHDAVAWFEQ